MKGKIIIVLVFFIGLGTSALLIFRSTQNKSVTKLLVPITSDSFSSPAPAVINDPDLAKVISTALAGTFGTYGIVIKNLDSDVTYSQNAHTQFEAASLYKLWVMGEAYHEIENHDLDMNEILTGDIPTLNQEFNISSDSAELTEGSLSLSVSDALNEMITISHNYSALLLSQKLTLLNISSYLVQNGFTESSLGDSPTTTPSDIALFLEKLYRGQLADTDGTSSMLSLLKAQTFTDGIPKYLPPGTSVAHKTGDLDDVYHDAGIVYSPKSTYIIVVMSQSDSPSQALERIALVSQAAYNYFNP